NVGLVWSSLGPTVGLNLFVWGLGVLYAFLMSERVPKLREAYRDLQHANKRLDRAKSPFVAEQKRIQAEYEREREKNETAVHEYTSLSEEVRGLINRLQAAANV